MCIRDRCVCVTVVFTSVIKVACYYNCYYYFVHRHHSSFSSHTYLSTVLFYISHIVVNLNCELKNLVRYHLLTRLQIVHFNSVKILRTNVSLSCFKVSVLCGRPIHPWRRLAICRSSSSLSVKFTPWGSERSTEKRFFCLTSFCLFSLLKIRNRLLTNPAAS